MSTTARRRRRPQNDTAKMAVGYVRVSTGHQVDNGVSLDAQRDAIRAECKHRGLDLVAIHADEGLSGRKRDRPGLAAAIADVAARGGTLVIYSLSRMGRSAAHLHQVVDELVRADCDLVSCSEHLSTADACGRMIVGVLGCMAQFEAEITGERTMANLAHIRMQGRRTGGAIPFGFTADAEGYLHENHREQRVLARMRELHDSGVSIRKIATTLDAEGLAPRGVRSGGARSSGRWQPRQVHRLLNSKERPTAAEAQQRVAESAEDRVLIG